MTKYWVVYWLEYHDGENNFVGYEYELNFINSIVLRDLEKNMKEAVGANRVAVVFFAPLGSHKP